MPKILCLDFDLTIATYKGWYDEGYVLIKGKPLPGARTAIKVLRASGYRVLIHSVRCGHPGGRAAIVAWLRKYNIIVDGVPFNKPPADIYIDDRAITFEGDWSTIIAKINGFKHWKEGA